MQFSHLRISDVHSSLNEPIFCIINADSGDHKLSVLHHSADSGWPALGTHLNPSLLTPTQHHHHTTLPLIEHLYEVLYEVLCNSHHRALSNNEALPLLIALCKFFMTIVLIDVQLHIACVTTQ